MGVTNMGRMITVDVDAVLALLETYGCGGPMPYDIFEVIGDCSLRDIDEYAKTRGSNYDTIMCDFIEFFTGYIGAKTLAEMREREGV